MHTTTRALLAVVARWLTLTIGVGLTALSFVNLVEVHNQVMLASPWWWLGLIGIGATGLGLGAPWSTRPRREPGS